MRAPVSLVRGILHNIVSAIGSLQRPVEFTCGDCERWERCGMPSSDDCIFRAEQIARGDLEIKRLAKALRLAMGWATPLHQPKTRPVMDPEIW